MKLDKKQEKRLSAFISKILRHSPKEFNITLDEWGFCKIEDLLNSIKKQNNWKDINRENILTIVKNCPKQRYEIKGEWIRARYGHSVPIQLYQEKTPTINLIHGTNMKVLDLILEEGIKSMGRQFVHLSETPDFAILSAKRRGTPALLKVNVEKALKLGVSFFDAGSQVWLSTDIHPECIEDITCFEENQEKIKDKEIAIKNHSCLIKKINLKIKDNNVTKDDFQIIRSFMYKLDTKNSLEVNIKDTLITQLDAIEKEQEYTELINLINDGIKYLIKKCY